MIAPLASLLTILYKLISAGLFRPSPMSGFVGPSAGYTCASTRRDYQTAAENCMHAHVVLLDSYLHPKLQSKIQQQRWQTMRRGHIAYSATP